MQLILIIIIGLIPIVFGVFRLIDEIIISKAYSKVINDAKNKGEDPPDFIMHYQQYHIESAKDFRFLLINNVVILILLIIIFIN